MLARTGLLLLALTGLYGVGIQSPHRSPTQSSPPEMPTVSLCTLLSKPADYHGKEMRIRAQYHIGFEYSYFDDPACKDYAVETTPYRTGNVVWAEFDKSVEASSAPEVYKEFKSAASLCCPSGWRDTQAELIITGKFFKADNDDGYGHSGRYALQFVVNRIEKVCSTKTSDLSPKENYR